MINEKSRGLSFLLTLLLGPLGLLYATMTGGIILIVIAIVTAPTVVGPLVCWVAAIIIGDSVVYRHNQSVRKFIDLMRR